MFDFQKVEISQNDLFEKRLGIFWNSLKSFGVVFYWLISCQPAIFCRLNGMNWLFKGIAPGFLLHGGLARTGLISL